VQTVSKKRPKFLLAENLGRLAKWLRILGYDAAIFPKISLHNRIRIAENDKRILLTRDKKEAKSKLKFRRVLIKSDDYLQQLREMKNLITFNEKYLFSRCSECNKPLAEIDKEKIKSQIPEYIYQSQNEFKICHFCGKIYWKGTHSELMLEKLKTIFPNIPFFLDK